MLYTIRGLRAGARGVNIRVRVLIKESPRIVKTKDGVEHIVVDTIVGDRTGTIGLSLWDDWGNMVEAGDIIDLTNGYVNRFKGRLRLNTSQYSSVEKVEEFGFPTVEEIVARREPRRRRVGSAVNKS